MIGYIAAILTTISFLPQAIKVIAYKETKSISLRMYIMQAVGLVLWILHGVIIIDYPLIISSIISAILVFIILAYKLIYK